MTELSLSERIALANASGKLANVTQPGVTATPETNKDKTQDLTGRERYYLVSTSPSFGGFYDANRRFQFKNNNLTVDSAQDRNYILKHYSRFVHEIPDPTNV